jgi:putative acetyltransferase
MLRIITPGTAEELDHVRALMRAFLTWHRARHLDDLQLIDRYFDAAAFDDELASLPGKYASPDGALLLATHNDQPAGCVALRRIDGGSCEMKRMFVYPEFHGKGVGRALAEAVIAEARRLGYRSMLLDTSFRQAEAQALYRRLGFEVVPPYYELPEDMRQWLVFMALELQQ